ncbi:MAG: diguanylate cyclase [Candidatus Limivivens sp.]|nr:diguanylate cyclase [Candidatus Limivivens sp.]
MNEIFLEGYIIVSVLIAWMDLILAGKSFQKNKTTGRFLGCACAGAAVVDISYLISILNDSYLCMSIMSSIYFVSIDVMLVCLLVFTIYFTKRTFTGTGKRIMKLIVLYTLFEMVVFAVNPFCEIAIHYVRRNTMIAKYSYQMKPLYWMHLTFTYSLVIVILILLIWKLFRIPNEYRAQYHYVILGILAIVSVNGIFLFWPGVNVYNLLDYSICGYSFTALLLYWSCFNYSTHGMLNRLKTSIFENIGQGIVLFDYNDDLILYNERADDLLGGIRTEECENLKEFLRSYNLSMNPETESHSFSQQCYIKNGQGERPIRCDIRMLKNGRDQKLGQLFVFSDAALETDLLTGFQNWESFRMLALETEEHFALPAAVAICDINSLSVINSTLGNQAGDQKIRMLADAMRKYFPKGTYFVRGHEANLIALCSRSSDAGVQECLEQVKQHIDCNIQYAVSVAEEEGPDILQAVQEAGAAMRAKKLLDRESIHSEMLTSLIRALQECDSDTEHHVRRTQLMGVELGKRIRLTDIQQSHLSLLCLLHDIGKIGIPLEILNKPGKLSEEEWVILRSHTEKGYEIARSSNELKGIAEEIRHHHERWDGRGYPDGLSCESIPLLSRVIAVVDAYDAMTNNRSYRSAMSVSDAVKELKRCAGTQFDPFIVSEFLDMLKEHPDYRKENGGNGQKMKVEFPGTNGWQGSMGEGQSTEGRSVHPVPYSRYLLDESMRIISVDENFERLTGYSPEDIRENPIIQADLILEEERTEYLCQTNASLAKSPVVFQEHKLRRKDGSDIYVFCFGRIYYDSAVRAERSEIIIADIANTYSMKMLTDAEQKKAQVRLKYWERTYRRDSLTGLFNHAAFRSDVEIRILEGKSKMMMLMMDVDRFKEYNDTYGHHNGDKFLILTAQALQMALRKEDRACRMGGDEFAAVLFFDREAEEAKMQERAYQIFDKVNMTLKSAEGGTGISMGAYIARQETSFNQMYEESDKALYQAKKKGRGKLIIS